MILSIPAGAPHNGDSYAGLGPKGAPAFWLHLEKKDYSENYYAAFLIDPDGNNVEAVCML